MENEQMKLLVALGFLVACLFGADRASAQPAGARVEVGAQAAILRLGGFNGSRSTTNGGIGGRVSFDLTNWMALDGEVNFFPRDKIAGPESMTQVGGFRLAQYRRRTDALAGLRIGARGERLGVFLKARPGITRLVHQHGACEEPAAPSCCPLRCSPGLGPSSRSTWAAGWSSTRRRARSRVRRSATRLFATATRRRRGCRPHHARATTCRRASASASGSDADGWKPDRNAMPRNGS
jgi:hypothetical protein